LSCVSHHQTSPHVLARCTYSGTRYRYLMFGRRVRVTEQRRVRLRLSSWCGVVRLLLSIDDMRSMRFVALCEVGQRIATGRQRRCICTHGTGTPRLHAHPAEADEPVTDMRRKQAHFPSLASTQATNISFHHLSCKVPSSTRSRGFNECSWWRAEREVTMRKLHAHENAWYGLPLIKVPLVHGIFVVKDL
jgi:hypothetical protein